MMRAVWKEPFFLIGFLFVVGLLSFSFYHHFVMDNFIYEEQLMLDEDGNLIGKAPFEPSAKYWFGSDRMGGDLFYQIISGAKYTLGIAFIGSFLRVVLSFLGGVVLLRAGRLLPIVKGFAQSFYYLPAALLVYFIVGPIISNPDFSFWENGLFQLSIIVLIAVPNTSVLVKEEIRLIEREEFITSAKLMGGSDFWILFKHVIPHLWPKLLLIYVQQVIAVLILLVHLGLLGLFFGGTIYREFSQDFVIPASLSNEWSGLFGVYNYQLRLAPWLVFIPVLSFAAVIMAFNFMSEGIKRASSQTPGKKKRRKEKKIAAEASSSPLSFALLSERKTG
jgi:peptide/nickel transport system permease protein